MNEFNMWTEDGGSLQHWNRPANAKVNARELWDNVALALENYGMAIVSYIVTEVTDKRAEAAIAFDNGINAKAAIFRS